MAWREVELSQSSNSTSPHHLARRTEAQMLLQYTGEEVNFRNLENNESDKSDFTFRGEKYLVVSQRRYQSSVHYVFKWNKKRNNQNKLSLYVT